MGVVALVTVNLVERVGPGVDLLEPHERDEAVDLRRADVGVAELGLDVPDCPCARSELHAQRRCCRA